MCTKESNFSCFYTHVMVINTRNIFGCGTEKKECGITQFFILFYFIDFSNRILGVGVKI